MNRSIDRLTSLDRLMLGASKRWPQDIGALAILDGTILLDPAGELRIGAVREAIASWLGLVRRRHGSDDDDRGLPRCRPGRADHGGIGPSVVWAWKSGAVSPRASVTVFLRSVHSCTRRTRPSGRRQLRVVARVVLNPSCAWGTRGDVLVPYCHPDIPATTGKS